MSMRPNIGFAVLLLLAMVAGCSCRQDPGTGTNVEPALGSDEVAVPAERTFREVEVIESLDDQWALVRQADGRQLRVARELLRVAEGPNSDSRLMASPQLAAFDGNEERVEKIQMMVERAQLATLYIGQRSGKRLIHRGAARPKFEGETYFPALMCTRSDCPGRGDDGEPNLFINSYIDQSPACPACLSVRDLESETPEQKRKYRQSVQPHKLPESAARLRELDRLHRKVIRRRKR